MRYVPIGCVLVWVGCAAMARVCRAADVPPPAPQSQSQQQPTTAPSDGAVAAIAVIDLDRAARDLGYAGALQSSLDDCRAQLQADVKQFRQRYEGQVEKVVQGMVPKDVRPHDKYTLNAEQSAEVNRDVAAERQQVAQLGQKADQLYAAYRAEWIRHYREALEPVVQRVARERRATVVLVKNDALMYAEPAADITDAVIAAARAHRPEVASVPFPRLEAPLEMNFPGAATTQPATP